MSGKSVHIYVVLSHLYIFFDAVKKGASKTRFIRYTIHILYLVIAHTKYKFNAISITKQIQIILNKSSSFPSYIIIKPSSVIR